MRNLLKDLSRKVIFSRKKFYIHYMCVFHHEIEIGFSINRFMDFLRKEKLIFYMTCEMTVIDFKFMGQIQYFLLTVKKNIKICRR